MQRLILILSVFTFLTFGAFASEEEYKLILQYQIKKDSINESVHKDSTLVHGVVVNSEGKKLRGAVVATVGMKFKTKTDVDGRFKLMLPKQNESLFFFKPEYSEIVTGKIDFRGGYEVEIEFHAMSNKIQLIMDKPVIYLYSDQEVKARINIEPKGDFTFTYPQYVDSVGWSAKVSNNSLTIDGTEYPYLFWEAQTEELSFKRNADGSVPGEYIAGSGIVKFLEQKLTEAGLNPKEKADFITFWAPKMKNDENYFIQFIEDEEYNKSICQLNVSPTPDQVKRLYMLFTTSNDIINCIPQKLSKINREGFVLIEWGGTEIPESILTLNR